VSWFKKAPAHAKAVPPKKKTILIIGSEKFPMTSPQAQAMQDKLTSQDPSVNWIVIGSAVTVREV
jgi:hypothetical protein